MMKKKDVQYGVGIDVSKKELVVYFMSRNSSDELKIRGKRKFDNSPSGIAQLLRWIAKYQKDPSLLLRIYLEVTGSYHEKVLFELHDSGYNVSLLMGKRVKAYGKSLGEDSKNDQRDSYVLAHMALSRKERVWKPVSKHIIKIRGLMRYRRSLKNSGVAYKNKLHALSYAKHASESVKNSMLGLLEQINHQVAHIEQEALSLAKEDQELYAKMTMIVESLTGLGIWTMMEVICETNGFSEFKSINQLIKYAGYDIIENQSGNTAGKTRISKNGNVRLRTAMYMPAMSIVSNKVEPFYALYLRIVKRNPKIRMKALVALQRKLLALIYTLWKKNEAFDPEYNWNEKNKEMNNAKKEVALSQT